MLVNNFFPFIENYVLDLFEKYRRVDKKCQEITIIIIIFKE